MKTLFKLLMLVVLFVFVSCNKNEVKLLSDDYFVVYYEQGSSWTGQASEAEIRSDGELIISKRNDQANTSKSAEYELNDNSLNELKELLIDLLPIKLAERYGFDLENAPTDLPVTKIKYITNNKTDSTLIYFPNEDELPAELEVFRKTLVEIILELDTLVQ
ncbi:MAG: hypothetical protein JW729_08960 [Bacteroidales bacterium]|nr:hypothetical protein [Bacteroidales bacterium]